MALCLLLLFFLLCLFFFQAEDGIRDDLVTGVQTCALPIFEAWPDSPLVSQATFALARTLVDLKRYDEAVLQLTTFMTKYPAHRQVADAQYLLGWTRLATGKTAEGLADLRAFVAAHPTHELAEAARRKVTEAVLKLGDTGELAMEYRALMGLENPTPESLHAAGMIAGQLGQPREQEAAWRRLLHKFPDHALARRAALEMAEAASRREQYSDAAMLAAAAAKSEELQPAAYLLMGEAQLKLKQNAEALAAFRKVAALP